MITVNFNGKNFLPKLLQSLSNQTLPPAEVIVVDNASTDGSFEYLIQEYPYVKVIRNEQNMGFADGNNIGIQGASNPLIALINNDTTVSREWLEHLVGTWVNRSASGERVGAVSPKIRYYEKFLTISLRSKVFTPGPEDNRNLGVAIDLGLTRIEGVDYVKPITVSGFHNEERWSGGRVVRWTSGAAILMLPIGDMPKGKKVSLNVEAMSGIGEVILSVSCGEQSLGAFSVGRDFSRIEVPIPDECVSTSHWVINNAGSNLDQNGTAADNGINQPDKGNFDQPKYLQAFCGCSVLFRKDLFLSLGGFDSRFFMYYEDADLSWRIRRAGYSIVYEPKAVVRHIHAGTSIEWSPQFRYFVTRNYWLNKVKNISLQRLFPTIFILLLNVLGGIVIFGKKTIVSSETLNVITPKEIELKAKIAALSMVPSMIMTRVKSIKRSEK